jgi:tetratricopeptide (TPR) repeat protein
MLTRTRVLLVLGLLGAALAAGAWFYFHSAAQLPTPPEAPDSAEPVVRRAVDKARNAVLESPHSGAAWGALAETFLANELEAEGVLSARVAARLDPKDPRWPYLIGGTHFNRGEKEAAAVQFRLAAERAEASRKDAFAPLTYLAESLLSTGDLDGAEDALRRARKARPDGRRALFDSGLLALARGDDQAARAHFRRCLDSPFTRKKARDQLAAIRQRAEDHKGASALQAEADRLPPDAPWEDRYVDAYMARSVQRRGLFRQLERLEAQGRFLDAARCVQPLTERAPDDDLAWLALGKALTQAGLEAPAEQALRQALELGPEKAQAHHYLSLYLQIHGGRLEARGDTAGAVKCFEEAASHSRRVIEMKPDHGTAHLTLGLLLKKLGHADKALKELRLAVHCSPEYGEIHYRLGEALDEAGKREEARERLTRAVGLAPPGVPWIADAKARLARMPDARGGKP